MSLKTILTGVITSVPVLFLPVAGAVALIPTGQPQPWEMGFQTASSPVMEAMNGLHNFILVIITVITLFVLGLLIYVIIRFNARSNPTPSRVTHNTVLEVLWTTIPILILIAIAIPSLKLLYFQDTVPDADMTIKAIGHQWYWSYQYPDEGFEFDALYLEPEEAADAGEPYLLATDTKVVVPVGKDVRVIVTADDVIHSWAVPSFGVKMDAVPGRLNETWIRVNEPGMYYGQCSELCGSGHAFMPIAIQAVSQADYDAWVEKARAEYARIDGEIKVAESRLPGAHRGKDEGKVDR